MGKETTTKARMMMTVKLTATIIEVETGNEEAQEGDEAGDEEILDGDEENDDNESQGSRPEEDEEPGDTAEGPDAEKSLSVLAEREDAEKPGPMDVTLA